MKNLIKHGTPPYQIAVLHGGPGAQGSAHLPAKELGIDHGVLEPLQTASTITGQVKELHNIIIKHSDTPLILIGWSWGAWLAILFTAQYPNLVKKLILVSSGVLEEKYVPLMNETRWKRLNQKEKAYLQFLVKELNTPNKKNKNKLFTEFGKLFSKTDAYDPVPLKQKQIKVQYEIYEKIWTEASRLRQTGRLLKTIMKISCPLIAFHGSYDPSPYLGVKNPLQKTLKNIRFILLKKCGHEPWLEKQAKDIFYKKLRAVIKK